ncbi:MAG: hypothetical protein WCB67_01720 [Solirubrobacteraceae bacterium]
MPKAALAALDIADPPEPWRVLGFTVDAESRIHLGGVDCGSAPAARASRPGR